MQFDLSYEKSEHEKKIINSLGSNPSSFDPDILKDRKIIFVCFTNRSGSNWLCELLSQHDSLNQGGEFLHFPMVDRIARENNLSSIEDYFKWLLLNKSSNDGNLICKIGWAQLFFLARIGLIRKLKNNTQFIFIERKKKIEQAVSFYKASQTKQWKSFQDQSEKKIEIVYDRGKLIKIISGITKSNMMFELFFSTFELNCHKVIYEELIDKTQEQIDSIMTYLNLESFKIAPRKQKMKIQRDNVNDTLKKKFEQDNMLII